MVHCRKFIQMKKVRGDMFKIIEKTLFWENYYIGGLYGKKEGVEAAGYGNIHILKA